MDASQSANTPDGLSWTTAFPYLPDGIAAADALSGVAQVWVAGGIYRPDQNSTSTGGTNSPSSSFVLHNDVELYGGFAGGETSLSQRDIKGNPTILTGALTSTNSYHVVTGDHVDASARLDGFQITSGRAVGSGQDAYGGGVWLSFTEAAIIRCTIIDNYADAGGGGAFTYADLNFNPQDPPPNAPVFESCSFLGNSTEGSGGGAYHDTSHVTFVNTVFSGNTAAICGGSFAQVGDGIRTHTTYINCTFTGNVGDSSIGAIQPGLHCEVDNCILWNDSPDEIAGTGASDVVGNDTDIEGGWPNLLYGTNIMDADPNFADADGADNVFGTLDDNPRLRCRSPAVDAGAPGWLPDDDYDLDLDSNISENLSLDRDNLAREVNDVDMGAYELGIGPCQADVTGDGVVNTADLLAVIAAWGSCPSCPEDIAPGTCGGGDGTVGVPDLLAVIANFDLHCTSDEEEEESMMGGSSSNGGGEGNSEAQTAVLICMAAAEENNLQGQAFADFLIECLCGSGVIDCDE